MLVETADGVTFLGHATVALRLGGTSVLTDPLLTRGLGPLARLGPTPRAVEDGGLDAVLISHLHHDHLNLRSLRRIGDEVAVVLPKGGGRLARRAGTVVELEPGESVAVGALEVTAVPARHDDRRAPWRGWIRARPQGYLIGGAGRRVYFAGDTELFPEMAALAPLDLALLPIWGWGRSLGPGHLDPAAAVEALALLRPRVAVPIHWGTLYPRGLRRLWADALAEPAREFARLAAERAPEVDVQVLAPGAALGLPRRAPGDERADGGFDRREHRP